MLHTSYLDQQKLRNLNDDGLADTHGEEQLTRQAELLSDVCGAISAFYAATLELDIQNNVAIFTASDFNRTCTSNGQGSGHGWGAHYLVTLKILEDKATGFPLPRKNLKRRL